MGVKDLAKKLNKEFKDDNLFTAGDIVPEYDRLPTGAFGFDYPLYGGLPYGRIITLAGLFHSGKTTAACIAMSAYQRANPDKICVYVDVEHALDLKFQAKMTGLLTDEDHFMYMSPITETGEQILQVITELEQEDDIGMIVLDSLPALVPGEVLENDLTKDLGMRGTIAKRLHTFMNVMTPLVAQKNNIFIMVNQVRVAGKTFTGAPIYAEPCGDAPQYGSSIKVRFGTRTFIKGDKNDASDGEGAEGFRLKFSITKNKCGPIARGGGFMSFNYDTGLMWLDDLFEIATKFGFIEKVNASQYRLINLDTGEVYTDADGKELKGYRKDLKQYIIDHVEFQTDYIKMLNAHITSDSKSYGDILDEREKAEIKQQEESVEAVQQKAILLDGAH